MKTKILKRLLLPGILTIILVVLQPLFNLIFETPSPWQQLIISRSYLLIILTVSWSLILLVRLFRMVLLEKYDISKEDNLKSRKVHTQVNILSNILIFITVLVAIGVLLLSFESVRKIGVSLFASAGVAGIIIGFAAQKVIGSIIAGIQLAITQPLRIDDAVVIENEWGWIEEINLTYVVVRIWDKRRLIVPSSYFIEKPFQNWTRTSADIMGTVFIYTDYNLPVEELRSELTRILKNTDLWDGQVNVLQVTNATENTMELRALMSAKNSPTAWDLRVHVREKLIEFIQTHYPDSLPRTRVKVLDKPK